MGTRRRIGHRDIQRLGPGEVICDDTLVGFGARRQKSDAIAYVLIYRTQEGRQRWHTIGRHGAPWVPDTARAEAKRLLGAVAGGADPAAAKQAKRRAVTVDELCDRYLDDAKSGRLLTRRKLPKKPSTIATDTDRIRCHIKPLLGSLKVGAVTFEDVDQFMHDVANGKMVNLKAASRRGSRRGGKGTARRTVGLLGAIFAYAVRHRMRPDNPARGIQRFAENRRDRRLSEEEYAQLGAALRAAEQAGVWPPAVAAVRFIAITGWRRGEVLNLRWDEVDLARRTATLSDTKTGRSARPLSHLACDVLRGLNLMHGSNLVFPWRDGQAMSGGTLHRQWRRVAALGALPFAVMLHGLRHSLASVAGDLGYAESTIAALLGHAGRSMTSRYIHVADAVLLAAADAVANHTARLMGDGAAEAEVIPLRA
jgi:integrase